MSGMPGPPQTKDPDAWTLDLNSPPHISIGSSNGMYINQDGTVEQSRENEDRFYSCQYGNLQLFIVLDGHDGSRACDFAQKHLPSVLCRSNMGDGGEHVTSALRLAFTDTESQFFVALDHLILQKLAIQDQIQAKATTSMQAAIMFPAQVEELQRLQDQIKGGTTAVVALILNNTHLWVANVGDSRAVLCYLDGQGKLCAEQISEDHNTQNESELARLRDCGLDESQLRRAGRLGVHQNTRSIGDYSIKGGYKDIDILSGAHKEPGTADPFISAPPMDITAIRGFLLLMSDGLYEAYSMCTKSTHTVNQDLGLLVQREMDRCGDLLEVAQGVVQHVTNSFYTMLRNEQRSSRMDDITLVIRNLGYQLGSHARPAPMPIPHNIVTAPPTSHNPFNFSQSPHDLFPQQSMIEQGGPYSHRGQPPYHQPPPGHEWNPPPREQFRQMHTQDPLSMRRSGSDPNIQQYVARPGMPPSGYPPQYADGGAQPYNYPQYPPPHPQQHHYYPPTHYPPSSSTHVAAASGQPLAYLPTQPHPPTSQTPQYPPPSHVQVATGSGQSNTHLTTHPYYENVDDVRQIRRRSTGDEGYLAESMENTHIDQAPQIPPRAPLGPRMPPAPGPPASTATNADPRYQTSQPVLPPPSHEQPSVTQHQAPNSLPSSPPPVTSTAVRSQTSTTSNTNDDLWMYGEPSGNKDVPPESDDAPTPMQDAPRFPDKTITAATHVWPDGGEVEARGKQADEEEKDKKDGEAENGFHVAVVDMPKEEASDISDVEEEEDGMIKPIIKFDKFPPDLSWEDI